MFQAEAGSPWIPGQAWLHSEILSLKTKTKQITTKKPKEARLVVHTHNPNSWKPEAGRLLWVQGQPRSGLLSNIMSQNTFKYHVHARLHTNRQTHMHTHTNGERDTHQASFFWGTQGHSETGSHSQTWDSLCSWEWLSTPDSLTPTQMLEPQEHVQTPILFSPILRINDKEFWRGIHTVPEVST